MIKMKNVFSIRKKLTLSLKNSFGIFCVPKIARQFLRISSVVNYLIRYTLPKITRGDFSA